MSPRQVATALTTISAVLGGVTALSGTSAAAAGPCDVPVTHEIGAVQGAGAASPVQGRPVTVEGVVVGDFQGPAGLGGVFVEDPDGDGDPATSDGIFVYSGTPLAVGDLVRVTGTVQEYYGLTEVGRATVGVCGSAAVPDAARLHLPADDQQRERLEGMLVSLDEPVTATESYNLARYGELLVSAGGRLYQPTNGGGSDDAAEQRSNDRRALLLDDGSDQENSPVVPFTDVEGHVIRLGDTLTGVEGVLGYGHGAYRLQPTADPVVSRTNPRTAAPDPVGGNVRVASFNVLNYFTTIDEPGAVTDAGQDPRGADSVAELERQRAKIVAAIRALDADVVGLMEIENDADDAAVDSLVAALNAAGGRPYVAVEEPDTGGGGLFGTDAIKVAMLYRPDVVRPVGPALTTMDDAFDNARRPLAQRFRVVGGGRPFTVVVNHFKSKGCTDATGPDADQGDGQGCYNAARVAQAQALLALTRTLDGKDVLLIGDLNSYGEEDPIHTLESGGFVDTIDARLPEADQYSYVFDGQAGYLDQALASPHLASRVTGVDIWHINADEARFLDYNTEFNPPRFYAPGPYRASDHDPVLVGLRARPAGRPSPR